MNQEIVSIIIQKYSHISGARDFTLLAFTALSQKYKQKVIKKFVNDTLRQEYFSKGISISIESLTNMANHWGNILKKKSLTGEQCKRELFNVKALLLMKEIVSGL